MNKKRGKIPKRRSAPKGKNMKKAPSVEIVAFGVLTVLMGIFIYSKDPLLNYPLNYPFNLALVLFLLCLVVFRGRLKKEFRSIFLSKKKVDVFSFIEAGIPLAQYAIVSWMAATIFFIPYNFHLLKTCENSPVEVLELPLENVSTYSGNRSFAYSYKGNSQVYYGFKSIMTDIEEVNDYKVVLRVQKGKHDVMRIRGWDIARK